MLRGRLYHSCESEGLDVGTRSPDGAVEGEVVGDEVGEEVGVDATGKVTTRFWLGQCSLQKNQTLPAVTLAKETSQDTSSISHTLVPLQANWDLRESVINTVCAGRLDSNTKVSFCVASMRRGTLGVFPPVGFLRQSTVMFSAKHTWAIIITTAMSRIGAMECMCSFSWEFGFVIFNVLMRRYSNILDAEFDGSWRALFAVRIEIRHKNLKFRY